MIKRKAINYEQWLADKDKNERIANTELTPSTPSEYYSSWAPTAPSAPSTTPTSGTPSANNAAPTVPTTPTTPTTEGDKSFAKWLSTDPAYQTAVKQAQMDYDRSRATYGAQGEALARSGLVGSGYSAWADSQAYAQMQREKENARNVGYAAWLGEEEQKKKDQLAAADALKGERATIVDYILGQNRAEITDGDMALLKGLGYSDEAINGAATALLGYKADFDKRKEEEKRKAEEEALKTQTSAVLTWASENGLEEIPSSQIPLLKSMGFSDEAIAAAQNAFAEGKKAETGAANKTFIDSLAKFNTDGDAVAFLEANGVDVEGMTDEQIGQNLNALIDAKLADGTIDAATASAYYRDTIILDEDLTGKSISKVAEIARDAADVKPSALEKLTDADHKAIIKASYDALGITDVIFPNSSDANADVTIKLNVNGVKRTYTCDWGGEHRVDDTKNDALSNEFGNAKLALKDGKTYYQYADGKWTEIKVKWGSKGSTSEGNNVLAVVAAYYGANKINRSDMSEKGKSETVSKIKESTASTEKNSSGFSTQPPVSTDTARTLAEEAEPIRTAYLNGNMTRAEAIEWLMTNQSLTERNASMMVDLWASR